jgi:hypothetical protein
VAVCDGVCDGTRVGVSDRVCDGVCDGIRVGVSDGVCDGVCDDIRVGVSDGVCDGACEGACDGVGNRLFVRSAHETRKADAVNAIKRNASRRDRFFFIDFS